MKKPFLLLLLLIGIGTTISAQQQINTEKLDSFINALYENDRFLGSVAIIDQGEVKYTKAVGSFDPDNASADKVNAETVYRIGSISKTFTTVIIMQLVEEGKISLDTKLSDYYPKVCNADIITIRHLLQHRSGIFNFTNNPTFLEYMTTGQDKSETIKMIEELDCTFEPGSQFSYSNSGFVLLGYIIETLDDRTYAESVKERITSKLGLKRTYYGGKINQENNEVASFLFSGAGWVPERESDMRVPHGAGALVSTPSDLVRFMHGLMNGKLVSDANLKEMKKLEEGFGLGIFGIPFYEKQAYGHNGGIDAFQSSAAYFPSDGVGVSVIANGLSHEFNDIMIGVLSCIYNKPFSVPTFEVIEVSEDQLSTYVGDYTSDNMPLDISITSQNGRLYGQATGQGAFPLDYKGEHQFEFSGANIVMEFSADDTGAISGFTLKQFGNTYVYTRK